MVLNVGDQVRVKDVGIPMEILSINPSGFYRLKVPYLTWKPPHGLKINTATEVPTVSVEPADILEKISLAG